MTALPPALARWARELADLPPLLVAGVAPWLGRLAVAIGPLPGDRHADAGELDGVDGLARRGSYERLLIGEWAIADELPDEFLRRAAGGEHLFVARAHRAQPQRRTSVVLVSAGPSQLGAPRLVHLAALVVLARRAAAAGAVLSWGVLERPDDGLTDGVDAAALQRVLRARSAITAGDEQVLAWRARIAGDDRWLIGGDEHAAIARALGATPLVVRDPLEPGAAAVEVEIGARTRIRLPLPPSDAAARLIRDPLGRSTASRVARVDRPARRFWFVQEGRRLAIDLGDRIEVWPIPGSPRAPTGHPRVVKIGEGERLIALGMRRRSLIAVTWSPREPGVLAIRDDSDGRPRRRAPVPAAMLRHLEGETPPREIGFASPLLYQGDPAVAFTGPGGELLIARTRDDHRIHVESLAVAGPYADDRGVVLARLGADRVEIVRCDVNGTHVFAQVEREPPIDGSPGVLAGCAIPARRDWTPYAIRVDERRWTVVQIGQPEISIEAGAACGVVVRGGDARLVFFDPVRGSLSLRGRFDTEVLQRMIEPLDVACASVAPLIAWATAGEIVVHSLVHHAPVLRIAKAAR